MKRYYDCIQDLLRDAGWTLTPTGFTRAGEYIPFEKLGKHTAATFRERYPDWCQKPQNYQAAPTDEAWLPGFI